MARIIVVIVELPLTWYAFIHTGIGVAFPLDTLKTKSQVLAQQDYNSGTSGSVSLNSNVGQMNMFQLIQFIYKMEGMSGEFSR